MSSKATTLQEPPVTEKAVRTVARPTEQEIAFRAHEIFLKRGATPGSEIDDWLQAERELVAATKHTASAKPSAPAKASVTNIRSSR